MTTETTASPRIHAQIQVSSGQLCYGDLHNIWHGASCDRVQGLPFNAPERGGTVIKHTIDYNISAKKGVWNAYHLVEADEPDAIVGWFVAHADVDPQAEIDKIIRVSGSPYEADSGSLVNCDRTATQGVFLMNRYDWGYYDRRAEDEANDPDRNPPDDGGLDMFEAAGLVDYEQAKEHVSQWCTHRSRLREANVLSSQGIWMHIPNLEYKFGRFGFDETRDAAHSFIFFAAGTYFARTCLDGIPKTLRIEETPQEFFERKVREDPTYYNGLEALHLMVSAVPAWDNGCKPPTELSAGPHEETSYIVEEQDLNPLFDLIERPVRICTTLKDPILHFLNELTLTYLTNSIKPLCSTPATFNDALNAMSQNSNSRLASYMFEYFSKPDRTLGNFNIDSVGARIKRFLTNSTIKQTEAAPPPTRGTGDCTTFLPENPDFITGLTKGVGFLLREILHCASNCAKDGLRTAIVPVDIRVSVMNEDELLQLIGGSWVFWNGESSEIYVPEHPMIERNRRMRAERAARSAAEAQ